MELNNHTLTLKKIGIDANRELVLFLKADSIICRIQGYYLHKRLQVNFNNKSILVTLYTIEPGYFLSDGEAALSNSALNLLGAKPGDKINVSQPSPLKSLGYVTAKLYGNSFKQFQLDAIIKDIANHYYSDIELSSFLLSCTGDNLNNKEIIYLTKAMIDSGKTLSWNKPIVADKHCIGGLPGNRTTPIIVPIIACCNILMPKTSSRAITSPAGTADTMEVLTNIELDLDNIRDVVIKQNACIAWGGSVNLSPADDILIRIERALRIDNQGQLVASILSKKIAAGANHVLIDIPIGDTAKIRTHNSAKNLKRHLLKLAKIFDIKIKVIFSDGSQPIGRGIGPCLEATDVLSVLKNDSNAPQDLKDKSIQLAGELLELVGYAKTRCGRRIAKNILESGQAWQKFQDICKAQGDLREPSIAKYQHTINAEKSGYIKSINNSNLSKIAILAGAPIDKAAGILIYCKNGEHVIKGQPLFTIHSEAQSQLEYSIKALDNYKIIKLEARDG